MSHSRKQLLGRESAKASNFKTAEALQAHLGTRIKPGRKHYAFFDEIQQVEGWKRALASFMVDHDIDLYVTGPNAHLLSSDLATYITGRYVQIPVYPLSFREFFDAVPAEEDGPDSRHAFSRYLTQGGFPFQIELGFQQEPTLRYLEDVYSTILFKDLVQRNDIREAELLERIMRYVFEQVGHPFSAKSIADFTRQQPSKPQSPSCSTQWRSSPTDI